MCLRINLAAFLLYFSISAFSQNSIFSENPVAIRYLLKHEGLKGALKKITLKDSTGKVISQTGYDAKGRMTQKLVGSGRFASFEHFSYDSASRSILQKTEKATGEKIYYKYVFNGNDDITNYYIANQAGNMFYSKRVYQYQDKLFITDSAYNPTDLDTYTTHQYNSKGQIIGSKTYLQKTRVLLSETSYEYKAQDGLQLVKMLEKTDYSGKGRFENASIIRYFDKNGNLVKEQNIGGTIFSARPRELSYQLDVNGNWISNTKKETREIEYYESPAAAAKNISPATATSIIAPTVILDENFDNNNNKWTVWDNEGSGASFYNGYYRFNIKQSNNYASWLNVPGLAADQAKDFTIETRVFLHTTERGNPNDSYWLLWGVGNNCKDFYAFGIYPDGRFQFGKLVANSWNGMAGAIRSAVIDTGILKANILRVEKRNQELFFYINRQKVYQAKFESFPAGFTGVGYQFNNKKLVDVDYLYIFQGLKEVATSAPADPDDSGYKKELSLARDSKGRAAALAKYLNNAYVKTDSLQFSNLLAEKLQQMAEIDFYAISEMLMTNKGPNEYKIRMRLMSVIPADQRKMIIAYSDCIVDNFQRRQNSLPEQPCPPANLPQPGYGLGKKQSSDPSKTTAVEVYNQNKPSPVSSYIPLEAQELVGHGYYKDTAFTDTWGDYYAITKIIQVRSISGDYADITYFMSNSNQLKTGKIPWKQITQYGSLYKPLQKNYNSCRDCGGAGTVQTSTSYTHTNDYEYTLGVKQKITTTTQSVTSCNKCGGCGHAPNDGSPYEWRAPYYSKKKKRT